MSSQASVGTATVPGMADKGWTARISTAAGAAAGTGAAQLGLGYGLGVVVWPVNPAPDDSIWLGSLGWATWIAASATVFGAVIAARLHGTRLRGPGRLALSASAAIGALVTVALIALPARSAVRDDAFSPQVTAGAYAILGIALGLILAYWAVVSRPVAANLMATAAWLWGLAITAIVVELTLHRSSATYLTSWQFAEAAGGDRFGTIYWPSALLTLVAAFLLGVISVAPATRRGDLGTGAATSGAVGPLLVGASFLALAPQLTASLGPLESAYLIAPYAVLAGLGGSALTVTAARASADRRARRAARTAPPAADPAVEARSSRGFGLRTGRAKGQAKIPTQPASAPDRPHPGPADPHRDESSLSSGNAAMRSSETSRNAAARPDKTGRDAAARPSGDDRGAAARSSETSRNAAARPGKTSRDAAARPSEDDRSAVARSSETSRDAALRSGDDGRDTAGRSAATAPQSGENGQEDRPASRGFRLFGRRKQATQATSVESVTTSDRRSTAGEGRVRPVAEAGGSSTDAERSTPSSSTDLPAPRAESADAAAIPAASGRMRSVPAAGSAKSRPVTSSTAPEQVKPASEHSGGVGVGRPTPTPRKAAPGGPDAAAPSRRPGSSATPAPSLRPATGSEPASGSGAAPGQGPAPASDRPSPRKASPTKKAADKSPARPAEPATDGYSDPEIAAAAKPSRTRKATPPAAPKSTITPPPANPTIAQINPKPTAD
jgi:hypothetical protein